jgi:hypothetical protein
VRARLVYLNSLEGYGMVMLNGFINKPKDKIPSIMNGKEVRYGKEIGRDLLRQVLVTTVRYF